MTLKAQRIAGKVKLSAMDLAGSDTAGVITWRGRQPRPEELAEALSVIFGPNACLWDASEKVYYTNDPRYHGAGCGLIVITTDARWLCATVDPIHIH